MHLRRFLADELAIEKEKAWQEGFTDANDNWRDKILPTNLLRQRKEIIEKLEKMRDISSNSGGLLMNNTLDQAIKKIKDK